jgi:hypothetical protein
MLLVTPTAPMDPSVVGYLAGQTSGFATAFVYGGPAAVDPEIFGELAILTS